MTSKNLVIIVGAGASFDCADPSKTHINENYRPPLVRDLFAFRRESFNAILSKYPRAEAASDYIRTKLEPGNISLERILKELANETDHNLWGQYLEIPLYLRELLGDISYRFIVSGGNRYDTLLRLVFKSKFDKVTFLTTNYDLFLEKSIKNLIRNHKFESENSYINFKKISLIKLHGSVNWGRKILNLTKDLGGALVSLDSLSERPEFDSGIRIFHNHSNWDRFIDGHLYYPAIAVPIEGKNEFVCPEKHIEEAKNSLKNSTNFLIIGFSAADQHILELLKLVSSIDRLMIVNGATGGKEAIDRISVFNDIFNKKYQDEINKGVNILYPGGFSEFFRTGELERFLEI